MSFSIDEVNFLVYRYLQESGKVTSLFVVVMYLLTRPYFVYNMTILINL